MPRETVTGKLAAATNASTELWTLLMELGVKDERAFQLLADIRNGVIQSHLMLREGT